MIDYATWQHIGHLHRVDKLTVAQIARAVSLDARTVHRWLDEPRFRARATAARPSKLDPYKGYIVRLLEHHRYSAVQIRQRLREAGYDGGLTIVKDYVRQVRPVRAPAFLTLHFAPGECAQVDWGHYGSVRVGNTRRRLSFFVMVLCYSRMMYVEFTVSQTLEHFLGCHLNAFEFFDARVPARIMIDNLRSAVLQRSVGPGTGVPPPLRGLRPPPPLRDRALQRRGRAREGPGRGRGGVREEELPRRARHPPLPRPQPRVPALARHRRQRAHPWRDPKASGGDVRRRARPAPAPARARLRHRLGAHRARLEPLPRHLRNQPLLRPRRVRLGQAHPQELPRPALHLPPRPARRTTPAKLRATPRLRASRPSPRPARTTPQGPHPARAPALRVTYRPSRRVLPGACPTTVQSHPSRAQNRRAERGLRHRGHRPRPRRRFRARRRSPATTSPICSRRGREPSPNPRRCF